MSSVFSALTHQSEEILAQKKAIEGKVAVLETAQFTLAQAIEMLEPAEASEPSALLDVSLVRETRRQEAIGSLNEARTEIVCRKAKMVTIRNMLHLLLDSCTHFRKCLSVVHEFTGILPAIEVARLRFNLGGLATAYQAVSRISALVLGRFITAEIAGSTVCSAIPVELAVAFLFGGIVGDQFEEVYRQGQEAHSKAVEMRRQLESLQGRLLDTFDVIRFAVNKAGYQTAGDAASVTEACRRMSADVQIFAGGIQILQSLITLGMPVGTAAGHAATCLVSLESMSHESMVALLRIHYIISSMSTPDVDAVVAELRRERFEAQPEAITLANVLYAELFGNASDGDASDGDASDGGSTTASSAWASHDAPVFSF